MKTEAITKNYQVITAKGQAFVTFTIREMLTGNVVIFNHEGQEKSFIRSTHDNEMNGCMEVLDIVEQLEREKSAVS